MNILRTLASLANDQKMIEAYMTGKDLYATMASDIYKMSYADCMEFYLDENGKKTDKTNPEGKKRRSATKSILLGKTFAQLKLCEPYYSGVCQKLVLTVQN